MFIPIVLILVLFASNSFGLKCKVGFDGADIGLADKLQEPEDRIDNWCFIQMPTKFLPQFVLPSTFYYAQYGDYICENQLSAKKYIYFEEKPNSIKCAITHDFISCTSESSNFCHNYQKLAEGIPFYTCCCRHEDYCNKDSLLSSFANSFYPFNWKYLVSNYPNASQHKEVFRVLDKAEFDNELSLLSEVTSLEVCRVESDIYFQYLDKFYNCKFNESNAPFLFCCCPYENCQDIADLQKRNYSDLANQKWVKFWAKEANHEGQARKWYDCYNPYILRQPSTTNPFSCSNVYYPPISTCPSPSTCTETSSCPITPTTVSTSPLTCPIPSSSTTPLAPQYTVLCCNYDGFGSDTSCFSKTAASKTSGGFVCYTARSVEYIYERGVPNYKLKSGVANPSLCDLTANTILSSQVSKDERALSRIRCQIANIDATPNPYFVCCCGLDECNDFNAAEVYNREIKAPIPEPKPPHYNFSSQAITEEQYNQSLTVDPDLRIECCHSNGSREWPGSILPCNETINTTKSKGCYVKMIDTGHTGRSVMGVYSICDDLKICTAAIREKKVYFTKLTTILDTWACYREEEHLNGSSFVNDVCVCHTKRCNQENPRAYHAFGLQRFEDAAKQADIVTVMIPSSFHDFKQRKGGFRTHILVGCGALVVGVVILVLVGVYTIRRKHMWIHGEVKLHIADQSL